MAKTKGFTLRLSEQVKDQLIATAVRQHRSMSNLAEHYIREGLRRDEEIKQAR